VIPLPPGRTPADLRLRVRTYAEAQDFAVHSPHGGVRGQQSCALTHLVRPSTLAHCPSALVGPWQGTCQGARPTHGVRLQFQGGVGWGRFVRPTRARDVSVEAMR
jgi:hypothetical protein